MPTYEYECEKCQAVFELFQSMKDKPLETCPADKCACAEWGQGKVRRLLGTGAGLIFKGSGFYITDYRSEGYKKAAKSDIAVSPSSSTSGTKPATGSSSSASGGSSSSTSGGTSNSGSGSSSGKA